VANDINLIIESTAVAIAKQLNIISDSPTNSPLPPLSKRKQSDAHVNRDGFSEIPMAVSSNFRKTCLSGPELDSLAQEQLESLVKQVTVFYRATPKHKMAIVKALQASGDVVAMTGDGGKISLD
jgi:magnesium-transporting ATPase (P-type)